MQQHPENEWIEWDGDAASIPSAIGWVQFSHETREQAEARLKTEVHYWPWYGEDEKPCIVAFKLEQVSK